MRFSAVHYGNELWSTWQYDKQLRPSTYWDTLNNDGSKFLRSVSLGWYGNGNLAGMMTQAGGPGVLSSLPSFAQTFQYDNVNRLTSASETNGWSQAYRYDAFGNLLQWGDVNNPQTNAFVNNQVNVTPMPSPYDKAGNQTMIDGDMLTYDALNRLAIITEPKSLNEGSASYLYDGQGQRVETIANGIPTVYVYDALGKLAAEYAVGSQPAAPCQTCYLSWDHLGTPRMVTDSSGTVVARHDYYPFGGEIAVGTGPRTNIWDASDTIRQKFTGKERDETGLDYFGARYYGSTLGRFTSPDPENAASDLLNPQSWNGYAYVLNSPLTYTDPDGRDLETDDPCKGNPNCVTVRAKPDPIQTTPFPSGRSQQPPSNGPAVSQPSSVYHTPGNTGNCVAGLIAAGAGVGAGIGGFVGGGIGAIGGAGAGAAGGTLVAPGVGTIGGGIAGGFAGEATGSAGGALVGAGLGSGIGYLLGNVVCASKGGAGEGSGSEGGQAKGSEYREKTRGANAGDRRQVSNVARQAGIDPRLFGDFIEEEKEALGRGPSENFSYGELVQLANDYKAGGGK